MPEIRTEKSATPRELPDVSHSQSSSLSYCLEQVGMGDIQMPVPVNVEGEIWQIPAKLQAFVSLSKPHVKGIHMSRLYSLLMERLQQQPLTPQGVWNLLLSLKETQNGLSESAFLGIDLDWPMKRKALLSELKGWRHYPVQWRAEQLGDKTRFRVGFEVLYSSTCPCSTALSEQILNESLKTADPLMPVKLPATPHAQRSSARIWIEYSKVDAVPAMSELIDESEAALGTPVQTAVKRQDEQEFARANAAHLMFCEDAARKLKAWLEGFENAEDYWVEVVHEESLHAHNAVARFVKGIPGGLSVSQKM